jgi:hypothetical protein
MELEGGEMICQAIREGDQVFEQYTSLVATAIKESPLGDHINDRIPITSDDTLL